FRGGRLIAFNPSDASRRSPHVDPTVLFSLTSSRATADFIIFCEISPVHNRASARLITGPET
ncbi:hypothetical protein, partial [Pseudomonas viridiflava]|uniref:hypothetical protein n=1 Tax=Pseudomonas viridiflava TaxID=33069 RepID=UPI00197B921D